MGNGFNLKKCIIQCKKNGYFYAARQYIGECYCGKFGNQYDIYGAIDTCGDCEGENVGPYRSCVYKISESEESFTLEPSISPSIDVSL